MPSLQCGKHAFLFPRHSVKFEKTNVIMYFWPRLLNCQTEKVPIQIDFSRTLPNSSKGINYFPKPNTKKLPSLDLKGKCTGLLYYTQHAVFIIVKSTMNSKAGNADVRGWRSSLASVLSSQFLWLPSPVNVHFTAMQLSKWVSLLSLPWQQFLPQKPPP